jgi:hypothetical protein
MCFQWFGKLPNALSSPCPAKTYVPTSSVRRCLRYSTTANPIGRMDSPLLAVFQPQAVRLGVRLHPFQADHLASPGAGQRNLTDNVYDRGVFLLGGRAEHPTQNSILRLRQSTLSHVVLRLADAARFAFGVTPGLISLYSPCEEPCRIWDWPISRFAGGALTTRSMI